MITINKDALVCGDCAHRRTPNCRYADMFPRRIESDTDARSCLKFLPNQPLGIEKPPVDSNYFDVSGRFIPKRLGDELLQLYRFKTMSDNRETYVYLDGVYTPNGENIIREEVRSRLGDKTTIHYVSEVLEHIRDLTSTQRGEFSQNINLVCLENGIYDLETGEHQPHNPNKLFLQKHPVDFDLSAQCPTIDKFLEEILPKPEDREATIQMIGYCLYRSYPIQKAFILVGDGSNGKSTLLSLARTFLGQQNVTATSLQELEFNRFATARLLGKNANIYPDLPSFPLTGTSKFKGATGGDSLTGEFKFGKDFNFENYAKFIFSANLIPRTNDESHAFFRRWIIIPFPNKFEDDKADTHLLEKLTTSEELSGLLNKALAGLKKCLADGKFANSKIVDDIRDQYIRQSDPLQAYIWDRVDYDSEAYTPKDLVYADYLGYCKTKNYIPIDKARFHKYLPSKQPGISTYRPRDLDGARPHCWRGIRLRENQTETLNLSGPSGPAGPSRSDFSS